MSARTNRRTTIHKGKVFDFIRENITFENGRTTDVDYVKHPGATAIVPLLDDDRVLLLRQYRHVLKKYIWEIPAGTLDPGETIISCAKRELIEETGYRGGQWQALGEITPVPGYSDERIHIFLATDLQPDQQHLDDDELIQVEKVKFQKALNMIATGEIQDAKSIIGLYLASSWLKKQDSFS